MCEKIHQIKRKTQKKLLENCFKLLKEKEKEKLFCCYLEMKAKLINARNCIENKTKTKNK